MFPVSKLVHVAARALISLLVVLTSLQMAAPVSAQLGDPPPVRDLASMVLNPLDLETLDYTGFAINSGRFTDVDQSTAQLSAQLGGDSEVISGALVDNSFVNAYSLELDQLALTGDPTQGLTQVVTTSILEFDGSGSAQAAFDRLATVELIPGSTDVSAETGSGFAAQGNISPSAGFAAVDGVVTMRVTDNRIAILIVVPETDATAVTPVMDRLIEKVDTITRDGGTELGLQTLRLTGPSVALDRGFYSIADRAALRVVTQIDEEFERFQERHRGVANGYQQVQVVTSSDGTRLQIRTFLVAFGNEDDASVWLGDALERQGQLTNPELIIVDEDASQLGDESISLTYSLSGGNGVRQGTFREGSTVVVIDIVSVETGTPPARMLLDELAGIQADCVADSCQPQEPPTAFTTGIVATPRAEDPTPESTDEPVDSGSTPFASPSEAPTEEVVAPPVEPTPSAEASPVPGTDVAFDELYGIQVAYDASVWEPVGTNVDGTRSSFDLTNGTSTISFVGDTAYAGDPRSCFDDALIFLETGMGAADVSEILDAAGNSTILVTDEAAQGLFKYTNANGELEAAFIYCTTLDEGNTTFLSIGSAPGAEFTSQFPIMVELIQTATILR